MPLVWIMGTIKEQIAHITHTAWKTKKQVYHISTITTMTTATDLNKSSPS